MKFNKYLAMLLGATLVLSACGDDSGEEDSAADTEEAADGEESSGDAASLDTNIVTIATGGSSGPYNIIATTLAEGYSSEFDVNSRTQTTGASAENLNLMAEEKVEMSFVMSDALTQAVNGEETFSEPIDNIQQVAALYPNFVQLISTDGAGIESVEDLAGKRVAVGDQNSGVEIATRAVLEAHGLSYDDIEVDYLGYAEASEAMRGGQLDAAFLTSGLPNASVMELQNSVDLKIVPIEQEAVDVLSEDADYFEAMEIPADTYGNEEAVPTVAIMNALVVRSDMSEDDVYNLTKYLFENLDTLSNAHQAANDINIETAEDSAVIDIHPGAQKYYDEQ